MKPATSNLASRWGLPRPIIKTHAEEKWCGYGLGKLRIILEYPFNISATTEASDFQFGRHLGFGKAHHKIPPRRNRGRGPRLEELPKNWGFPFNIYAMAESIDFKFGTQFGWPIRPVIKSHK